jgi:hypothetical protein
LSTPASAIRLAHVSDIHVHTRATWRARDWLNKRLTSWVNLRLMGRGKRFASSERVLDALREDLRRRGCDRLIFSGDATALGFEEETQRAAELLGVGRPDMPAGLAVPGNHDYLTAKAAAAGHFEHYFAPWLAGERVGAAVYPFAQRVGPAWIIAVNSCRANWWPTDASGRVGIKQLQRLETLLKRLEGGPRILVTHYPICRAAGEKEHFGRRLHDLEELIHIAARGRIGLWLHGHCHDFYHIVTPQGAPFPIICAGSTTQRGRWSYGDYTLTDHRLAAVQRVYDETMGRFMEGCSFEVEVKE